MSFILRTFPICIVGFLFPGSVSGLSFYQDLHWWRASKTSVSPHCFLVGSKDGRVVWWERGMSVCPLSCVTLIVPLVLLSPPCALRDWGPCQRNLIQFYTVIVFICFFLWFSHLTSSTLGITLLIKWSYSCSQALSFKNANKQLVCGKMIVRPELCSLLQNLSPIYFLCFFDNFTRSLLIASYNCMQQWLKDCNHDVIPVLCSPKHLNNLELGSPSSFHPPPPPFSPSPSLLP